MGAGRETPRQADHAELLWFTLCHPKSHYQSVGPQVALPEAVGPVGCGRSFGHWSLLSKGVQDFACCLPLLPFEMWPLVPAVVCHPHQRTY